MPVDNRIYDRLAESWHASGGVLHMLKALVPVRFAYMRQALQRELDLPLEDLSLLDLGCGGGLLAEEFARAGCRTTGIDPSERSLAAARAHAAGQGLAIDYLGGCGERIPAAAASFDLVTCCDVLEHVDNPEQVVAEIARVLKDGGIFLYDTLNRTFWSWFVAIKVLQEWTWSRMLPDDLHDWRKFIRPAELLPLLDRQGLDNRGLTGLGPAVGPLGCLRILRQRNRGRLSYFEAYRYMRIGPCRSTSLLFMGYAVRRPRRCGNRSFEGVSIQGGGLCPPL